MPSPCSTNWTPFAGHAMQIFLESKDSITGYHLPDPEDIFAMHNLRLQTFRPADSEPRFLESPPTSEVGARIIRGPTSKNALLLPSDDMVSKYEYEYLLAFLANAWV